MIGVVADASHDLGSAEALRVLERGVGNLLAGFQIEEAEHDRRRAEVHREAVDRRRRSGDLLAVEQDAIAVACNSGIERCALVSLRLRAVRYGGQAEPRLLNPHLPSAHRVATHDAVIGGEGRLAREPER
jgi:hypothetical protein